MTILTMAVSSSENGGAGVSEKRAAKPTVQAPAVSSTAPRSAEPVLRLLGLVLRMMRDVGEVRFMNLCDCFSLAPQRRTSDLKQRNRPTEPVPANSFIDTVCGCPQCSIKPLPQVLHRRAPTAPQREKVGSVLTVWPET